MSSATLVAPFPVIPDRKRLGQYFTGIPLARLLAAIVDAQSAKTILDPMAGRGDMLQAVVLEGAAPTLLGGIEIDHVAFRECADGLRQNCATGPALFCGSAFDRNVILQLPCLSWDLVITNPPYVRYQSLSVSSPSAGNGTRLPTATEVRSGLLEILEHLPSLDVEDRRLFVQLTTRYSGLADLAVPSWILCAALVRLGGSLAMVVPESWLSRDYSAVVQYMLLRWFRVKYVIEDANAAWFPGTLVKTALVVAERIERRRSAFAVGDESYLHVTLPASSRSGDSIVGALLPGNKTPEKSFARSLHTFARHSSAKTVFPVDRVPTLHLARSLNAAQSNLAWLSSLDDCSRLPGPSMLPPKLARWLPQPSAAFTTLETLGVSVGQGLRTGANQFFYVDALKCSHRHALIRPSKLFPIPPFEVPSEYVHPVLRRQAELPSAFVIRKAALSGRALTLNGFALPEDITSLQNSKSCLRVITGPIAKFIRTASKTTTAGGKLIPALSAVAPNVTSGQNRDVPSFWYTLPPFARRHLPALVVPRVISAIPKAYLNAGRRALIDANFSTMWLNTGSVCDEYGLLALLNSSWTTTFLELSASVMGGGALKLEASHLRRLPVPTINGAQWKRLAVLGRSLSYTQNSKPILDAIDKVVLAPLIGTRAHQRKLLELRAIRDNHLQERSAR